MLGATGAVTVVGMALSTQYRKWLPPALCVVFLALSAVVHTGVTVP